MKKVSLLLLIVLALMVVPHVQGVETNSQTLANSGTIQHPTKFTVGLNYLSAYHVYDSAYTSDEVLNRDFAKFKQDGVDVISLSLYWYRLEGNTQGSYDGTLATGYIYGDAFLDNVKHVISIANQNGVKVLVTFHTLWGDDSIWCTPDYVIDPYTGKNIGLAIVRDSAIRQAFINTVTRTIEYLSGTEGIWAWAILNEPWYWGTTGSEHDFITENGQTQKENFITLFNEISNVVKSTDGRPVTIRFCNTHTWKSSDGTPHLKNIFTDDWSWDQRLFDAIDFISFNAYMPTETELQSNWLSITTENIEGSVAKNIQTFVTEIGHNNDADTTQTECYESTITSITSLPIEGVIAWYWESDMPDGYQNFGGPGKGYNLCASADGEHRPAYEWILQR